MKKFLILTSSLAIVLSGLLVPIQKAVAESTADQYCMNTNSASYESLKRNGTGSNYRQAFTPVQNRVNSIAVKVGGNGVSGLAILRVFTAPTGFDNELLRSDRNFTNLNSAETWYFNDFGDITLTPGTTYYISLTSSVDFLYWYSVSAGDCTPTGMAYKDGAQMGYKLHYSTFGYTYSAPVSTDDATTTTPAVITDTSGQTTGTGTAPATTTSTTIKVPTALATVYRTDVAAVNLTWTKSATTDIDGYKVFRSEEKTKNFKEIGKTNKATAEYLDGESITAEKTFFYFVRAYKGSEESASSSTVEITIPAPVAVEEVAIAKHPLLTMNLYDEGVFNEARFNALALGTLGILILLLVWHEIRRSRKSQFLTSRHFKFEK